MEPENTKQTIDETVEEQIVTFQEEGEIEKAVQNAGPPEKGFTAPAQDFLIHSIKDFLERPIELDNFVWPAASAAGTLITLPTPLVLPNVWATIPMIAEKLKGFMYLRCGFKIRVQVNAQPFNAGRLLILYKPVQQMNTTTPTSYRHFGGGTGYHRLDLDLSSSTAAEITIPFTQNISHFDLLKGLGAIGEVEIYVYSALTGSTDVHGTVWITASDVDIQMATGIEPVTSVQIQSDRYRENEWNEQTSKYEPRTFMKGGKITSYAAQATTTPASNVKTGSFNQPAVASAERKQTWKFSSISKTIGTIGGSLGWVPVIGTAAAAVGWVASAVGGIASLFGYSKPYDDKTARCVQPAYQRNLTNYDGDSKAKVLGINSKNENKIPVDIFTTDKDEMSLAAVLARPTFAARFSMTEVNVANQVIFRWPVSPDSCSKIPVNPPDLAKLNTMLSYVAEMFNMWRGSINYHFKIVKTKFHSGRIRVSFVPGMFQDTDLSLIDINKVYSQIFDLRECDSFDFSVPYIFHQPWVPLTPMENELGTTCESIPTGMLLVEVLNTLRRPTTAADHIEFIMETSAGEDFMFNYPGVSKRWHINENLFAEGFHSIDSSEPSGTLHRHGKTAARGLLHVVPKENTFEEKTSLAGKVGSKTGGHGVNNIVLHVEKPVEKIVEPVRIATAVNEAFDIHLQKFDPLHPMWSRHVEEVKVSEETATNLLNDTINFVQLPLGDFPVAFPASYCQLPVQVMPTEVTLNEDGKVERPVAIYPKGTLRVMWANHLARHPEHNTQKWWNVFVYSYPIARCFRAQINTEKFPAVSDAHLEVAAEGMGEVVVSLKQLLKRYINIGTLSGDPLTTTIIFPYVTAGVTLAIGYNTMLDRVALLYRWVAGNMRLGLSRKTREVFSEASPVQAHILTGWESDWLPNTGSGRINTVPIVDGVARQGTPVALYFPTNEEFVEFEVPFFQRNPALLTSLGTPKIVDIDRNFISETIPNNYGTQILINGAQSYEVWMSIGEDFAFGYLVGPPITTTFAI